MGTEGDGAVDSELRAQIERLRDDEQVARFLWSTATDGIWLWDFAAERIWVSDEFRSRLGLASSELDVEGWRSRIHPADFASIIEEYEERRADPDHHYDRVVRYVHEDGSTRWFRSRAVILANGGDAHRMLAVHDEVTDLARARDELVEENAELSRSLADARTRAEQIRGIATSVALDLRNPLADAVTTLESDDGAAAQSDPRLQRVLVQLRRGVGIIDDLVGLARAETGSEPDPAASELAGVVDDVLDEYDSELDAANVAVEVESSIAIPENVRFTLHQVLCNLVENAHAHADPARPLEVRVAGWRDGDDIAVTISDNGTGIPTDQRASVLAGEGGPAVPDGTSTSVGLPSCRVMIEYLGGSLDIGDGIDGTGTTVTARVPDAVDAATPPASTVMIVEDDVDSMALAMVLVEQCGGTVVASGASASEAVERFIDLEQPPALAMIDHELGPGGTGLDVARSMLAMHPGQRIVLRSAHMDAETLEAAERLGVTECVRKESIDELRSMLVRHLSATD